VSWSNSQPCGEEDALIYSWAGHPLLFKTKICTGGCSTRYLGDEVQQRVNKKKRASIKRLKEKTLRCLEFFLLYTLDYVPGFLAGC
jgi:hypothetical protein